MSYELIPSVQTALEVFREKRKDNFERVMQVAHLLMDGTVGTIVSGMNSMFQTYALIQGRRDARKIVEYTTGLEETKIKAAIEMKRFDVEAQRDWYKYDLQKSTLTLYVDKKYQETIDKISRSAQYASREIESQRCRAIREIDKYTISVTKGMDYRYSEMLRQEEIVCAVYRNFINDLSKQNISKHQIASQIGLKAIENSHKLSDAKFKMVYDAILEMTKPNYVTFDEFVRLHNKIKIKSLIG